MNATKGTAIDIDLGHSFRNLVVPKNICKFWHNWIHDSAASRTPKNRNEWLYWNTLSISGFPIEIETKICKLITYMYLA